MSDPIEDYIRANRDQHARQELTQQLVAAGHDPAAVEAAWTRLSAPQWNPQAPKAKSSTNWPALLLILGVVVGYYLLFGRPGAGSSTPQATFDTIVQPPGKVVVVYGLTGSATGADLTYTDGSGNIQQQSGVAVPLKSTSGSTGLRLSVERGSFVSFSAQNTGESGDLTCTISADGHILNTGHSSGGYTIVSCSATIP